MSEAAIAKKAEIVKQTTDMLNAAQSAIVVDYRGLVEIHNCCRKTEIHK